MRIYRILLICVVTVFIAGCMSDTPAKFITRYEDCVNRKDIDCIVKNSSDHLIEINGGLNVYKTKWPYTFNLHSKMTYEIISVETTDSTADVKADVKLKQTHYFSMPGREPFTEDFIWTLKKDTSGNWKLDNVEPIKAQN